MVIWNRVGSPIRGFQKVKRRVRHKSEQTAGGGERRERKRSERINYSIICGRSRGRWLGPTGEDPGKGEGREKVHFAFKMDRGVGGGATSNRNPRGVEWVRHLRGRFHRENMPPGLPQ